MGEIIDTIYQCTTEDVEEALADLQADGIPWCKRSVDGRVGEGNRCPDQHGADVHDRQGSGDHTHADMIIVYHMVWRDGGEFGKVTRGTDGGRVRV